jgi:hypothetical protein
MLVELVSPVAYQPESRAAGHHCNPCNPCRLAVSLLDWLKASFVNLESGGRHRKFDWKASLVGLFILLFALNLLGSGGKRD